MSKRLSSSQDGLGVAPVDLKQARREILKLIFSDADADWADEVPVEEFISVKWPELRTEVSAAARAARKSVEAKEARELKEMQDAVHERLVNEFNDDVNILTFEYYAEGKLMDETCEYYEGARCDVYSEFPDNELIANFLVEFTVGKREPQLKTERVARLKFDLKINLHFDVGDDKIMVEWPRNCTAQCVETVCAQYPSLLPRVTPEQRDESDDRLIKLFRKIAVLVGVEKWVMKERVSVNLINRYCPK